MLSSPEEVLRRALISRLSLKLGATEPVLPALLGYATYLLDRHWVHAHSQGGRLLHLHGAAQVRKGLMGLIEVLRDNRTETFDLSRTARVKDGNHAWQLLPWLTGQERSKWERQQLVASATPGLRAFFGEPLPNVEAVHEYGALTYNIPLNSGAALQGQELLTLALDTYPLVHGWVLKHELTGQASEKTLARTPELARGATLAERREANAAANRLFWA